MRISPEQWPALSRLLDEALELEGAARARLLETLPPAAAALGGSLRALLDCHARAEASDFLGALPWLDCADIAERMSPAGRALQPGAAVGGYLIEAEAGRGGMSVVYRAHRADGLIKRPVALKLLHAGQYSAESLARFARERDILAGLTHPGIARLYDAGSTESGQPYIALEFVDGAPLVAYCDGRGLDLRARLALFRQVLAAVQFAHSNLVIHRDLKPSNILVTASGEVRLLDFGIAKPMPQAGTQDAAVTELGTRALTPDYASPEQIRGEPVSTASDVYALGVVLCELLCGSRPYRLKRTSAAALEEAILSADPVRPSEAVLTSATAAARASTVRGLSRALAGDLDTIVLKTLNKNPASRYATADAFDQDLGRYLRGEPVLARPDSRWYRARRFLRRHRLAAASALAVLVALAAGLGVALWQARRAGEEARVARSVETFLQDLFEANSKAHANPLKAQQTTARELLDLGAAKIDTALADSPRAKLEVLATLGAMYHDLGLDEKSADLQRRRVEVARRVYGPDDVRLAGALRDLSLALPDTARVQDRLGVLGEALAILDRAGDRSSALRANVLGDLAQYYSELDLPRALGYAHASSELLAGQPPSGDLQEALVMEGEVLNQMARYAEAEALLSRAVVVSKQAYGDPNPHLPHVYIYLAEPRYFLGDFAGAEHAFREAFRIARELEGANNLDALQTQARLGTFLGRTGRNREGLALLRDAYERGTATLPADDAANLPTLKEVYGWELARFGALDEGNALLVDATDAWKRRFAGSAWVLSALERSAFVMVDRGDYATARELLDESTRIRATLGDETTFPNGNPLARAHLALALGDWSGAEEAVQRFRLPPLPPGAVSLALLDAQLTRAEIALGRGDYGRAQSAATEVATATRRSTAHAYLAAYEARALRVQGLALLAAGQPAGALAPLEAARRIDVELYDPDSSVAVAAADAELAQCLAALGRPADGRGLLAEAERILGRHASVGSQWTRTVASARAALRAAR